MDTEEAWAEMFPGDFLDVTTPGISDGICAVPSVCYGCGYISTLLESFPCVNTHVTKLSGAEHPTLVLVAGLSKVEVKFSDTAAFD